MMNDDSTALRFFRLLDEVEDYLDGGIRKPHAPLSLKSRNVRPAPSASPANVNEGEASGVGSPVNAPPIQTTPDVPVDDYKGLGLDERKRKLADLAVKIAACTACRLHEKRRNTVPGIGALDPLVMVIGEGPGADEDASGMPFVGPAGQYLDKWLDAIEISRHKNAYIANIVKCRPPNNRDPGPEEAQACHPYLLQQIALVRPRTILSVGRIASQMLIGKLSSIGSLRGRVYEFQGIPLVPTYHPSGVLRNPDYRRPVWEDMKLLRSIILR